MKRYSILWQIRARLKSTNTKYACFCALCTLNDLIALPAQKRVLTVERLRSPSTTRPDRDSDVVVAPATDPLDSLAPAVIDPNDQIVSDK